MFALSLPFSVSFFPLSGLIGGIVALIIGILILIFPRILNYLVGIGLIIFGILGILGGSWVMGILSLVFGIVVMIFPRILNYLIGAYLIIVGLWFIFTFGFAVVPLITGIIMLVLGIIVFIFPAIINVLIGIAFIIQGVFLIGHHFGWF
jgi:hypothetical protein